MSKNGHLYSNENLKPNLLMYFLVHKNEKWSFCEFATVYATMHSNKNGSLAMMCIDAKQSFQSCFSLSRLIYFITGCRKCFIPKPFVFFARFDVERDLFLGVLFHATGLQWTSNLSCKKVNT